MQSYIDRDVYIEFRFADGQDDGFDTGYRYFYENMSANEFISVNLKTEYEESNFDIDIREIYKSCDDEDQNHQPVQFSMATLSQVMICDYGASGDIFTGGRYKVRPLGGSCGSERRINVSEGY